MKNKVIDEFKSWLKSEGLSLINTSATTIIAVYIRVSTNKQEELSPISQLKTIYKYAMAHNMQIDLNYIFIEDEGVSGKSAEKRKEFINMVAYAKSKEHLFDSIVVWKFSRFARNQEESIVYKSLLKKNNVNVISVSEDVSEDSLGPFASLIERIIEWMDEYYVIRLSGEVTRGMTQGAEEGKHLSVAPFGYRWTGDINNRQLVIKEDEANIIKMIYNKFIKDEMSMLELARYINSLGFKTKRGGMFENRTINYILLNPIYKGYTRWTPDGKLTREELYNNNRSIIKKGSHPPIVSEEIWQLATDKIEKFRTFRKPHQISSSNPYDWVMGLVRCKKCGKTLIRTDGKLRCNGYNKGACDVGDKLDIEEVKELILGEIKQYIANPINIKITKRIKKEIIPEKEMLINQLEFVIKKEERIKNAYINGIDTLEEYKKNKSIIETEKITLQEKISKFKETDKNEEKTEIKENLKKVYNILTDDKIEIKKKYDIAHELIDKVEYENGSLSLFFNNIK